MNRSTLCVLIVCCTATRAWAAWPTDLSANVPVDTLSSWAYMPAVIRDDAGGTLVAWTNTRGDQALIRAQHFDANGQPLWTTDGMAIAPGGPTSQRDVSIVSDGAGGAILTWEDLSDGAAGPNIYAQRVTGAGELAWGPAGVLVCSGDLAMQQPLITTDGTGGAIIVWHDNRLADAAHDYRWQICGQRVSAAGEPLWQANGRNLTSDPAQRYPTVLLSDGQGGAIAVLYGDHRFTADQWNDVFALRVNAAGDPLWGPDGVGVCTLPGDQEYPVADGDGSGGAVIFWIDRRNGPSNLIESDDVYGQKLDAAGSPEWTPGGIPVCTLPGNQGVGHVLSDGSGGAFLTWSDGLLPFGRNHVQRISASGSLGWGPSGVLLSSAAGSQQGAGLSSDGSGGVFTQWLDNRDGNYRVFAQRLSGGGTPLWAADGVAVSNATGEQESTQMVWDGVTGAVVVWADNRTPDWHIYAQGFGADGVGTGPVASAPPAGHAGLALAPAGANPSRGAGLWVQFALEGDGPASIDVVDVSGRRLWSRRVDSLGPGSHVLELLGESRLTPGVYLATLREGTRLVSTRLVRLE